MSVVVQIVQEIVRRRFDAYRDDHLEKMPAAVVFSSAGLMAFKADPEILRYDPVRLFGDGQKFYDTELIEDQKAIEPWRVLSANELPT